MKKIEPAQSHFGGPLEALRARWRRAQREEAAVRALWRYVRHRHLVGESV